MRAFFLSPVHSIFSIDTGDAPHASGSGRFDVNFLKYELNLDKDEIVEVSLDKQANIRLLDQANFQKYRDGQQHRYHGGLAQASPFELAAPSAGKWVLDIDLGGYPGSVKASVRTFVAS